MINDNDIANDNKSIQIYFKKILVGIDGSEKSFEAADYAINLAGKYKSELLLIVNVFKIGSWYHGEYPYSWGKPEVLDEVYEKEKQEMQNILNNKIKNKADKLNLNSKIDVIMTPRTTDPSVVLVDHSKRNNIDLIIVGTRGRTGFKKLLLGSVASGIVTSAHCPVLVIK
ncbi:MAG TPA: universal stress protein [Nitrososphaeraceae archaeon]|nr:universal stress protein [Nitrososphaeraceae archaeon]